VAKIKVLMAGESWTTHSIHVKGFDSFETSTYAEGGTEMIAAMRRGGIDVTYQPAHVAMDHFPSTSDDLAKFDVVILSDLGANSLLLPTRTFVRSEKTANRLALIHDFVMGGGGLLMIGGYLTFQGIQAKGNYHGSPVEDAMPVTLLPGDDRVERPDGAVPRIVDAKHAVMKGLTKWPAFLGYNRSIARKDADVLADIDGDPFIAVRKVGKGRSAIFASDCGPHWGPPEFLAWNGYGKVWTNLARWLAAGREG
jgi:uncharacterized membrane protein